ncbi:MAG: photosynthetic complex putative assembly protein PuhB [Hyphomicrobiaceae bacterium]
MSDEFEAEPIRGIPAKLPEGERILWQGAPDTGKLARRAFHAGPVAIYFGVLMAWSVVSGLADGAAAADIGWAIARLTVIAAAAVGVLVLLAWANHRTTVYTITSRRVVMRYGIALPMSVNLPFRYIASADLKSYSDGSGDLALSLEAERFLGFIHLWPHVRAWHLAKPQPTFRSIDDAAAVARILADAIQAEAATARVHDTKAETSTTLIRRPQPARGEQTAMPPSSAVAA